ncbi:MAG: DUF2971 domain-containing protein [Pseudomonadota bacterium]|nr:DUF2971 domain-containing protein [Pseudomonadota bacterium]
MAYQEYAPRSTLFQFTSLNGFRGIVGSKELWFSDIRTLNDPRELVFGLGRVRPTLQNIIRKNDKWDNDLFRPLLEQAYNYIKTTDLFACSFCLSGDAMPLWQRYGDSGKGISIGFRPRAILDIHCRIQRVDYVVEDTPTDEMEKAFFDLLEPIARLGVRPDPAQVIKIVGKMVSICTATKHESWKYEEEVRAVFAQSEQSGYESMSSFLGRFRSNDEIAPYRKPLKREGAGGEVSYIPFKYGKKRGKDYDPSQSIEKVIVGPFAQITPPEVRAILSSEGFENFEVKLSECVWR